jgi:hypothetical protein
MPAAATKTPSSDKLIQALLARAERYSKRSGVTLSEIGKRAVNDVAFISDLKGGRNVTMKLYDRFREFLDDNEPDGKIAAGREGAK